MRVTQMVSPGGLQWFSHVPIPTLIEAELHACEAFMNGIFDAVTERAAYYAYTFGMVNKALDFQSVSELFIPHRPIMFHAESFPHIDTLLGRSLGHCIRASPSTSYLY